MLLGIVTKVLALVVAGFAIIAGLAPHVFLRVPRVGFILHAIAGGNLPPFFATEPFKPDNFDQWAKSGDVIISGGAKSGTTWLMNILHQLRSGGDDSFDDIQEMVPWLDQLMYPGQTWDDMLHRLKQEKGFSSELPFHVFKTHEHPPTLPVKDQVKYVVLIRNATDIFASIKPFFASFSDAYRGMWGGFPPMFANDDAFYDFWLKNAGGGVSGFKQFYVEFVKEWWPYRNQPNVFFLHYSDMRNDFPGSLDRLCDFLKVRLTKEKRRELPNIPRLTT